MIRICLSSYSQDRVNAARVGRENALTAKQHEYDQVIAGVQVQRDEAASKFIDSAKNGEIFAATGNLLSVIFHNVKMLPLPPSLAESSIAERRFECGIFGENAVARIIETDVDGKQRRIDRTYLDDTETVAIMSEVIHVPGSLTHCISGYRNRKGEIDLILVTPWGIAAIEVKNVSGEVYTIGCDWFRDTYDKRGYLCDEAVPIRDRGGRGPARQLDEPTALLDAMLKDRGFQNLPIQRIVVLAHEDASVGNIDFGHNRVDMVTNVRQLDLSKFLDKILRKGVSDGLDKYDIEDVSMLIQEDHARCAQSFARS